MSSYNNVEGDQQGKLHVDSVGVSCAGIMAILMVKRMHLTGIKAFSGSSFICSL